MKKKMKVIEMVVKHYDKEGGYYPRAYRLGNHGIIEIKQNSIFVRVTFEDGFEEDFYNNTVILVRHEIIKPDLSIVKP